MPDGLGRMVEHNDVSHRAEAQVHDCQSQTQPSLPPSIFPGSSRIYSSVMPPAGFTSQPSNTYQAPSGVTGKGLSGGHAGSPSGASPPDAAASPCQSRP